MLLPFSIFVVTLVAIIWRPYNIQIGTSAIIGAVISFLVGTVSFNDMIDVTNIVWDSTLTLIGIIILSMVFDEIGFFEWLAIKMAKLSKGNGKLMFVYTIILGSIVSALFANDGAVLILTPILLSKMRILNLNFKTIVAFLLAGGFISDSASLPFVFSNLTNIITAEYFDIGFLEYLIDMTFPFFVSVIASLIFLLLILWRDIPDLIDINLLKNPDEVLKNKKLFYWSWIFLAILLILYFIGDEFNLPISLFALSGGIIFLGIASYLKVAKFMLTIKTAPWQIVWFSIGLYIVVYGLKNAGLTEEIKNIIIKLIEIDNNLAIIGTGFLSAFLSAIMNNLPTVMIMDIALGDIVLTNTDYLNLAYANIIGCNLGPKMTPFGSLATLLWLHVLERKGVKITFWEYSKFGLIITPPVLLIVLLSLTNYF